MGRRKGGEGYRGGSRLRANTTLTPPPPPPSARPGRPPKRVHCSNPVDTDVLEKLKRRKLDIPGDYPYDQRFYDRKPLMNGFPPVGYPTMPQFSNFFGMHHLMQPMAMASHIGGLRTHHHQQQQQQQQPQQQQLETSSERAKMERSNSDSGLASPKAREDRLPVLGMYGTPSGLDSRLTGKTSDGETNKPLNLQINGHSRQGPKGQGSESAGSRSEEEEEEEEDADIDDDKISDDERPDGDMDDSYDSSDEFQGGDTHEMGKARRPPYNGHPYSAVSPSGGHPEMFVDFEAFVLKFNSIVRALVDAAKAVEKKAGEEKNQISVELIREKERRQELEREMQQEKKKRAFFQRRVRRLKKAIQGSSESVPDQTRDQQKPERPLPESSPEPVARNAQEAGQHDSDSEKTANTSTHSESERERKSESSSSTERNPARRESYDPYNSSRSTPPATHHTPPATRHTPPATSPIKFPFHQMVSPAQDV
ncbi:Dachshund-like protein 1 [Plakobranchus ocellatus]|uniref:Dachshund-like protein 1 n=1 Tax=Plakobranchus ocellatus TaxID=259542 RepID=A0AAV3YHU4_9GAST|nr:Dachshund-like protein 1 [Plakobranchus ocellatus]